MSARIPAATMLTGMPIHGDTPRWFHNSAVT